MNKLWLVIQHEYLTNLKRPMFLIAAFITPVFILGIFVVSIAIAVKSAGSVDDLSQVGYVDHARFMNPDLQLPDHPDLFEPYSDETTARAALDSGILDAYFVIPSRYLQTGQIQLYSQDGTPDELGLVIGALLVTNLSAGLDLAIPPERLVTPVNMTVLIRDTGRELTQESVGGLVVLPIAFGFLFAMATQMTGGFLMSGLVTEKTNKVIEILMTSVTPMQLIAGKIIGLCLLGLTQILVWLTMVVALLALGQDVPFLEGVTITPVMAALAIAYFLCGYFMTASIMTGISAVTNSEQESRQYTAFVTVPFLIPIYLTIVFINNSNGTLPIILSLFPFTAPMSMIMRYGFGHVPAWQLAVSFGLMILTTVFFAWISAKVFRWGMLSTGKQFSLRDIRALLRRRFGAALRPSKMKESAA